MFEDRGSPAPSAPALPADGGAPRSCDPAGRTDPAIHAIDLREEALERLAAMVPGAELANVIERLLGSLLRPASTSAPRPDVPDATGGPLLDRPANPGERALTEAAESMEVVPEAADALADLGADALSEVVAACARLSSWAQWAAALAAACLARTPELSNRPAQRGPVNDGSHVVSAEENRFTTSSEIACRLGISRVRAQKVLDRGRALATSTLAPTERLHRAGLIDEAKTALIASRLDAASPATARAVQAHVLPRAARRTHAQLARDIDRALTIQDPDGSSRRRLRNAAQRRVTRPRPAGEGVHEMAMLLPTMDAFLLDSTLSAVAASARAAGDGRTPSQLRADALVAVSLRALRTCQQEACRSAGTDLAARTAPIPASADLSAPARPTNASTTGGPVSEDGPVGNVAGASEPAAGAERLMPDGVPLEGMLTALSDLVGSTSPSWTPSGTDLVPLPPGLVAQVDVTVPLDHLTDVLDDPDAGPPAAGEQDHTVPPKAIPCGTGGIRAIDRRHGCHEHPEHPEHPEHHGRYEHHGHDEAATLTVGGCSAPVPAVVARALAAGGTWRRIVTDPLSGAVVDVGRRRYRPPAAMADLVRARDGACTHPGCSTPARRCDLDHITPWSAGGITSLDNLTCLCQAHHRLKHTPGWSLSRATDGVLVWRTPTGNRYRRDPDGTITMLPRRVGPRSVLRPAVRVPDRLAGAVTTAVLNRLDKGLARADLGLSETPGGAPVLATRGPRPGQRPGAYETVPYAQALHTLGLTALLDEVPPF